MTIFQASDRIKSYGQLHVAVFLWGFTAILGGLISLSAISLVWWRVGITALFLLFIPRLLQKILILDKRTKITLAVAGMIIGLHWICFYGSIKLANASIALIAMSLTALFTSFIEPYFYKKNLSKSDIFFGLAVIPGMILINRDLEGDMRIGLIVGILAALLSALFAVINKQLIEKTDPLSITFVEMFGAWLFITMLLPLITLSSIEIELQPSGEDWIYLLVLVVLCTILPFVLQLRALKHITAFAANLVFNLEPVYGIILAAIILKDHRDLNSSFYVGVLIILMTIFLYPFRHFFQKLTSTKLKS